MFSFDCISPTPHYLLVHHKTDDLNNIHYYATALWPDERYQRLGLYTMARLNKAIK